MDLVRAHADATVVVISVGGNDVGFSGMVKECIGTGAPCVQQAQAWIDVLDQTLQPKLRATFTALREHFGPHALVYAMTYPNPTSAPACPKVGLDEDEVRFLSRDFIPRLNEHIEMAAALSSVRVIDIEEALVGDALCARGDTEHGTLMNGIRWQHVQGWLPKLDLLVKGSMHPTSDGHVVIADLALAQIDADLSAAAADAIVATASDGPLPPPDGPPPFDIFPPGVGPTDGPPGLPPFDAELFGPPEGPWDVGDNACTNQADDRHLLEHDDDTFELVDVDPGTDVCWRIFSGTWEHDIASSAPHAVDFAQRVPPGIAGWRDILYQDGGTWTWLTLRPSDAVTGRADGLRLINTWAGGRIRQLLIVVVIAWLAVTVMIRQVLDRRSRPEPGPT